MTVHIQTKRRWSYNEGADDVRTFPPHQVFSVDDDVGLLAIAEDAAFAVEPLDADQQKRLDVIKAAVANDEAAVAALLGVEAGDAPPAPATKTKKK